MDTAYDIIVAGAGHAGCEAALAAARCGLKILLITLDTAATARMSCNPAIGGLAKGHLVREIDALGGQMAKITDSAGIQFRMLNQSKGPAVWSPRAQADKQLYSQLMYETLIRQKNLTYTNGEIVKLIVENNGIAGIGLKTGETIPCRAVILTCGTFLGGKLFRGKTIFDGGRINEQPAVGLTACLTSFGIKSGRLKTGTPPRIDARTINWSQFERQDGDPNPQPFSFSTESITQEQVPCYLGWTNEKTHNILREGFSESPLFTGIIKGIGPRYCPSIEVKICRFADKTRHQLFLEPEGRNNNWIYLNGYSTSLPANVQICGLQSIPGFENVSVLQYGYAVEYDYFPPEQLYSSLESKAIERLYFAGQVNGTSGYEEAAAQGIIAGINAVQRLCGEEPIVLKRSEAYIGVLIDDLITKPIEEPYRLFTALAEYRLLLRQDNADERLMYYGRRLGLISDDAYKKMEQKRSARQRVIESFKTTWIQPETANNILMQAGSSPLKNVETVYKLLCRPELTIEHIKKIAIDKTSEYTVLKDEGFSAQVEMEVKYAGYIERLNRQVELIARLEDMRIPDALQYAGLTFLSMEAREKLNKLHPRTVGQVSRIAGISPADIANLVIHLRKHTAG